MGILTNGSSSRETYVPYGQTVTFAIADTSLALSLLWEILPPTYEDGTQLDPVNWTGWAFTGGILSQTDAPAFAAVSGKPDVPDSWLVRCTETQASTTIVHTSVIRVVNAQTGVAAPAPAENDEASALRGWWLTERKQKKALERRGQIRVYNGTGSTLVALKVCKVGSAVDFRTVGGNAIPSGSSSKNEKVFSIALANPAEKTAAKQRYCVLETAIANGTFGWGTVQGDLPGNFAGTLQTSRKIFSDLTGSLQVYPVGQTCIEVGTCVDAGAQGRLAVDFVVHKDSEETEPSWFGADEDVTTDDTTALQLACVYATMYRKNKTVRIAGGLLIGTASATLAGGCTLNFEDGGYLTGSGVATLTINARTTFKGTYNYADIRGLNAATGAIVKCYGRVTPGDGGEGQFVCISGSVSDDDGNTLNGSGRPWRRLDSSVLSVANYGPASNAKYQNPANGKWYTTAAYTTEANDNSPNFHTAISALSALGGGTLYIPPGNWYLKTKYGGEGEFFTLPSNVTVLGEGDGSAIRIGPGFNTVPNLGYSCVFGRWAFTATTNRTNNVKFRDFLVDCNSAFNQWPGANYGGVSYPQNAAVSIPYGDNVTIDSVSVINHAGVFCFLVGIYGYVEQTTNWAIRDCRIFHIGDDPNIGDCSLIGVGATNGNVSGNRIDYGGALNIAYPNGAHVSAIEIHGSSFVCANNQVNGCGTGLNIGGESYDMEQMAVAHNTFRNVETGIVLFGGNGKVMRSISIATNLIQLRKADGGGVENGIICASNSVNALAHGLGIFDLKINDNTIIGATVPTSGSVGIFMQQKNTGGNTRTIPNWTASTAYDPLKVANVVQPTVANGYYYCCTIGGTSGAVAPTWPTVINDSVNDGTARWLCAGKVTANKVQTGGGYEIYDNKIYSFAQAGIMMNGPSSVSAGNLLQDVHIQDNKIRNVNLWGIYLGGSTYDTSADFVGLEILNNTIVDDRGGSAQMQYAIFNAAWTDATSIFWGNRFQGYTVDSIYKDTINFPNQVTYDPSEEFRHVGCSINNIGAATEIAAVVASNKAAATGGTPVQNPPGYGMQGRYWDGAASKLFESYLQTQATGNPNFNWSVRQGGAGAFTYPLSVFWYPIGNTTGWSAGTPTLRIDQSGQALGTIENLFGAGGNFSARDSGGNEVLGATATAVNIVAATTTPSPAAGAAGALPATPVGYATIKINGTARKFPYY